MRLHRNTGIRPANGRGGIGRRSFLKLAAADAAILSAGATLSGAARKYPVGVGSSSDPYEATRRAVEACGLRAPVAGRTVAIKPNLVVGMGATTGVTTDPEVVRALVDLCLAAGAARILIVEGSAVGAAPFSDCGYDFFRSYDPLGRIELIDLAVEPVSMAPAPDGFVYDFLYLPSILLDPDLVFISAAKLKTHFLAAVTLSLKNLVGLAPAFTYGLPGEDLPRYDLHARGIDLSIVDLNLARPVDFAVIDGVWAMEGEGPVSGTPVAMNLVLAGPNAAAVDLAALGVMEIPPGDVLHLYYAAQKGLGPFDSRQLVLLGDPYTPRPFVRAVTPPVLEVPTVTPGVMTPKVDRVRISYRLREACAARAEIIRDNDVSPGVTVIRTLRDWSFRRPGTETLHWNGAYDGGSPVPPGKYLVRVAAVRPPDGDLLYASAPVAVLG